MIFLITECDIGLILFINLLMMGMGVTIEKMSSNVKL